MVIGMRPPCPSAARPTRRASAARPNEGTSSTRPTTRSAVGSEVRSPRSTADRVRPPSRGGPVGWRTDPLQENEVLGVLLYKAGQLTREQLQESVERMQRDSIRQGEALMEMGLVGFSQLTMILGKQCEFILTRVLTEREGTWAFHELDDLPEKFLPAPLRIPSLLFRREVEASKAMPSTELADYLRPRIDEYIHFDKKLLPLLRDVKFTAAESKLVATMQSDTWRSREVLSVSPLSKQNTVAVLRALIEVGCNPDYVAS